jgi:prepilin-type N-terminal cleavage/methylation domain-containing protein
VKRGFTLIEVLLGLTLLAVVLGVVQGVYSGVVRSRERARVATENARAAALLLQRLADELGSAVPESLQISSEGSDASTLEFTTEFPQFAQEKPTSGKKTEGAFARLRYEVTNESDGTRALVRSIGFEESSGDEPDMGTPEPLFPGVVRFRVQWSSDAQDWRDSFAGGGTKGGPGSAPQTDAPKIVRLEIAWRDGGGNEPERILRTSAPLYRALG